MCSRGEDHVMATRDEKPKIGPLTVARWSGTGVGTFASEASAITDRSINPRRLRRGHDARASKDFRAQTVGCRFMQDMYRDRRNERKREARKQGRAPTIAVEEDETGCAKTQTRTNEKRGWRSRGKGGVGSRTQQNSGTEGRRGMGAGVARRKSPPSH